MTLATPSCWTEYVRDLVRLARFKALAPSPARDAHIHAVEARLIAGAQALKHDGQRASTLEAALGQSDPRDAHVDVIEGRLIEGAPVLKYDGQRATALEAALACGSKPLLRALPEVGTPELARLDADEWRLALKYLDSEALEMAYERGLTLDAARDVLINGAASFPAIEPFILGTMSRVRFWYPGERDAVRCWMALRNPSLAARFLRAQVSHHPETASRQFRKARINQLDLEAVIWHLAGAATPADIARLGDPILDLVNAQPSNHARMKARAAYRDLEQMLAFHGITGDVATGARP